MPGIVDEVLRDHLAASQEYAERFQRIAAAGYRPVEDRTSRRKYNRKYWTPRRYTIAERQIRTALDRLVSRSRRFYEKDLANLFLAGAQQVVGDYRLTDKDMRLLARISDEGMIRISASAELAKRDVLRWSQVAEGSSFKGQSQKHSVRGIVDSRGHRYTPDKYRNMVLTADASRTYNLGIVAASELAGYDRLLVSDGKDCGWTSHDDPQSASGMIVTLDEAASYPIAHAHCQRTFTPYKGSKKSGDRLRNVGTLATKAVVGGAVAAVAGAATLRASTTLQARLTELVARSSPEFSAYRARVMRAAIAARRHADDLTDEIRKEMDDWALGAEAGISSRTRELLGLQMNAPRRVVGDTWDGLDEMDVLRIFGERDLDLRNSVGGHTLGLVLGDGSAGNVGWTLPRVFRGNRTVGGSLTGLGGRASASVGRDLRFSASRKVGDMLKVGMARRGVDRDVIPFVYLTPSQFIKYRISSISGGIAQRLVLNPNGVLRAGFRINPDTGLIVPSLRFIPKGPLRIYTEVNRSAGTVQHGNILVNDIRKILNRQTRGESPFQVSVSDVLRRGKSGNPGFLHTGDFAPGTIRGEITMYSEQASRYLGQIGAMDRGPVIRRGTIRNALSILDPDTGKRIRVDLHIRNGKFVTEYTSNRGRVNSVSAVVRLNVRRNVRFNLRANVNLRGLGLDSLSDIRHLSLRDLSEGLSPHHFRITSFGLELSAFGRSIFELARIMRISWNDAVSLMRNIRDLSDSAFRELVLLEARDILMRALGRARMEVDEVVAILRDVPDRVRNALGDASEIVSAAIASLREKYVTKPIDWVVGSAQNMQRVGDALRDRFRRPEVTKLFPPDDPPTILPGLPGNADTVEDMAKLLYLSPQELADELGTSLADAMSVRRKALAYFRFDREMPNSIDGMPLALRRYTNTPTRTAILDTLFDDKEFSDFLRALEGRPRDGRRALESSARARQMDRDIRTIMAMVEDQFPGLPEVEFRFLPENHEFFAYFSGNSETSFARFVSKGLYAQDKMDDYLRNPRPVIWIDRKLVMAWDLTDSYMPLRVDRAAGTWDGIESLVHEIGHYVHWALGSKAGRDGMSEISDRILDAMKSLDASGLTNTVTAPTSRFVRWSDGEITSARDRLRKWATDLGVALPESLAPNSARQARAKASALTLQDYEDLDDFIQRIHSSATLSMGSDEADRLVEEVWDTATNLLSGGRMEQTGGTTRRAAETLEEWIRGNQTVLSQRYLSSYGTTNEYEFLAEAWLQHWLRGEGTRPDPIGESVMRVLREWHKERFG